MAAAPSVPNAGGSESSKLKGTATVTAAGQAVRTVVRAPAFKIVPMSETPKWLNMLVYGPYGIGKTYLAGTAEDVPRMNDIILINAEAGALTLASRSNIDSIEVTSFKQMGQVEEYLRVHCKYRDEGNTEKLIELEAKLKGVETSTIEKPKEYRTCIVDSLTELDVYSMYQELGITEATGLDEDVVVAGWDEYKRNLQRVSRTTRKFRNLPMHTILICSSTYSQDEKKAKAHHPSLTGKLSGAVQGFMDMVGFLTTSKDEEGKPVRRLHVSPSSEFDAKNRFTAFKGTYIDNPTMESILKAVELYKS